MAFARTVAHATAADATFSAAGTAAWNGTGAHTPAVSGATVGGIPYCPTATSEKTSDDLTFNDATGVLTIGGSTAGAGLVLTGGTITTDVLPLSITQTRNALGVVFSGLKIVYTATAQANGSKLIEFLSGAAGTTAQFGVREKGVASTYTEIYGATGLALSGGGTGTQTALFTSAGNMYLYDSGGNLAALWNGIAGASLQRYEQKTTIGWTNTANDPTAALTAGLSQISSGVVGVGTGVQGSFAGRLKLTSAIAAGVAIASLNASPTTGEIQSVTDALAPVAGAQVASGGSAKALVWWNNAQWTVIGV